MDGFQPYNTEVIFGDPRCAFSPRPLDGEQSKLKGEIFRGPKHAFWGNCTLAHFWSRPLGQGYFMVIVVLPELFFENTGWIATKLDSVHPQELQMCLLGQLYFGLLFCSHGRPMLLHVCIYICLINFKFITLLDLRCGFREICLSWDLCSLQ